MKIIGLSLSQFGGSRDLNFCFKEGLNVILGPNESGKSTLVHAMSAALFQPSSLDRRSTVGRDFLARFLPRPAMSCCDSALHFSTPRGNYLLRRQWGDGSGAELTLPDGTRLVDEDKIEQVLDQLFVLGRHTYKQVMFARQEELKAVLEHIRDDAMIDSIGSLLRKAVMQLDGVSVDKLSAALEQECDRLLARWDSQRDLPQGNRGLSNPWQAGVGEILRAWYAKEGLGRKMGQVEQLEQEISQLQAQVLKLTAEKKETADSIEKLSAIEGDIIQRAQLAPQQEKLMQKAGELKKICSEWPQKEEELTRASRRLQELDGEVKQLDAELAAHETFDRKRELEKLMGRVEACEEQLAALEKEKGQLPLLTAETVEELGRLKQEHSRLAAAIAAGSLRARVASSAELPAYVTRDLEDEIRLEDEEIEARGYLKIRLGDKAEIEVRAGKEDFAALRQRHREIEKASAELLKPLGLKSAEEAEAMRQQIEGLERDIQLQQQARTQLLGEMTRQELAQEAAALADLVPPREKTLLLAQQDKLGQEQLALNTRVSVLSGILEQWQQEYAAPAKAMDRLADVMGDLKQVERQQEKLQPLPAQFASAGEFTDKLGQLRRQLEAIAREQAEAQKQLLAVKAELPQESMKELQEAHDNAAREFESLLQRGKKLLQVKEAFQQTVAEMDGNTFAPLARSFSKYLARITLDNFTLGNVDAKLNLDLEDREGRKIPVSLLSSGTYDSTALALRFALLEHIFGQEGGVVVLDDCLVDLDPGRKQQAVAIIREYAEKNQVIFTTCNPETARELGGSLIELQ